MLRKTRKDNGQFRLAIRRWAKGSSMKWRLRRETIQGFLKLGSIEDSAVRTFRKNDATVPPIDASKQPLLRIRHGRHDSNSENVALLKKISGRNVKGRSGNR